MKKLLLTVVSMMSVVAPAMAAALDYPEPDRFVEYNVKGTVAYILKDTKTGCEYLTLGSYSSYTLVEGSCTNLPTGASK